MLDKVENEVECTLKISIFGTEIRESSMLQVNRWTIDMVKLQFDFQNTGVKPIKKGTTQAYITASGCTGIDLIVGNDGDVGTLKSMQLDDGGTIYQFPELPSLAPGGWQSWTIGLWSHKLEFMADNILDVVLSLTNDNWQKKINFKVKLLPIKRTVQT